MRRIVLYLSLVVAGVGYSGCTPELIARRGTRGAVIGAAEGLADMNPALLARLHQVYLGDTNMQRLAQELTRAIVLGGAEGLKQAQVDQLTAGAVKSTMDALREQGGAAMDDLARRAGPQLEAALRVGVSESILSAGVALRQSAQRDLAVATNVLVKAAVTAAIDAIRQSMKDVDLDRATERYARETLAPAAGLVMRTMMREALIGVAEGAREGGLNDQVVQGKGKDAPLRAAMREIGAGLAEGMRVGVSDDGKLTRLLTAGIGVLAALLLGCLVAAIFLWKRYQRTTRSLVLFARKLNDSQRADDSAIRGLREAILTAHADTRQDAWLSRFLNRRGLGPLAATNLPGGATAATGAATGAPNDQHPPSASPNTQSPPPPSPAPAPPPTQRNGRGTSSLP